MDVMKAIEEQGKAAAVEAGERRLVDLGLGVLPLTGFAVLCALLVGETNTTALDVSKNALSPPLAEALCRALVRAGSGLNFRL